MNGVKAKDILGVFLLPRIIPRAKALFASGFGYMAFLMANIYGAVRLLPREHPYLNPANIGRFGIRHVIGEAANNLVLKKENADQIMIFMALLFGVVILLMQLALIVYAFIFKPAFAGSIFLTPNPGAGANATDMAFIVLDQVFGIPNLFCTDGGMCTTINAALPWPFHVAFHELLRFYSLGLLIVGVVIFLYYVLVVVGETATTGHPFGQRFQNVWVPIRLVVALGLLIPINYGLNSGQYIVLYAAKFGSGFATNGWLQFNATLRASSVFPGGTAANPTGERNSLLAKPQAPSIMPVVQAMSIVHACAYAYWKVETQGGPWPTPPSPGFYIQPYLVKQSQPWMTDTSVRQLVQPATSYVNALNFYNNSDIIIRFGRFDASNSNYDHEKGRVAPLCGDIRIPITYLRTRGQGNTQGGADQIQEYYFNLVRNMWFNGGLLEALPQRYIAYASHRAGAVDDKCSIGCGFPSLPNCAIQAGDSNDCSDSQVSADGRQTLINTFKGPYEAEIVVAWNRYNTQATDIQMRQEVLDRGWAGAGIWYNTIAEINGAFTTAVVSLPYFESYPGVMERVRTERQKADSDPSSINQFKPNLSNGNAVPNIGNANDLEIATMMHDFFVWWNKDDPDMVKGDKTVGGGIQDAIKAIFGVTGLFALRGENAHIHPLAQLAAVGKALVDSAIINIGTSTVTAGLGGLIRVIDQHTGDAANFISGITMTIAFLGLTAGFVLYYVLPFLPFLYFFFAFGTWVKSIFEAMVGVPLWALAHLRLDGEGLPGDSASSGYFLIFEIFVRPILTVFGLVAAVLILTAQVRMLNVLWTLVTDNLTGFEGYTSAGPGTQKMVVYTGYTYKFLPKNDIDQFFFTLVYAIIVYMMATASFKLIDKIPDQILRFMGAGVSAFSDINPDPTEGLTRYAALGGITVGQQATQGLRGLAGGVGGALGEAVEGAVRPIRNAGSGLGPGP